MVNSKITNIQIKTSVLEKMNKMCFNFIFLFNQRKFPYSLILYRKFNSLKIFRRLCSLVGLRYIPCTKYNSTYWIGIKLTFHRYRSILVNYWKELHQLGNIAKVLFFIENYQSKNLCNSRSNQDFFQLSCYF